MANKTIAYLDETVSRNKIKALPPGIAGQGLQSNGPGNVPSWADLSVGNLQNLCINGEFGCWSNGVSLTGEDSLGPDLWYKTSNTLDLERETSSTYIKGGQGCKVTKGQSSGELLDWNYVLRTQPWYIDKFKGRTVTMGAWVYDSHAANTRLHIYDGTAESVSAYHPGDSTFKWLEITRVMSGSTSDVRFRFAFEAAADDVSYISKVMVSFGGRISSNGWNPIVNEIIPLETTLTMLNFNNDTISADSYPKLTTELSSKVPPNVSAFQVIFEGEAGTIEETFTCSNISRLSKSIRLQVSGLRTSGCWWVGVDEDTDFGIARVGTWVNVTLKVPMVHIN
jgi:hypothetical protein